MIDSLLNNGSKVSDQSLIMSHVVDFFSSLLSAKPEVARSFWTDQEKVSAEENAGLLLPLSKEEIFETIRSTNPNSASGPDGFSIPFFRKFWPQLRGLVLAIVQGFRLGTIDISRLNYVVLTLIPKVKGTDKITQFKPITLINNFAKIRAKGFAMWLSPIADRTLSPFQSAFVKGHFILDDILCLHEIVHDIRASGTKAVILKLDFEKAYDSVSWDFLR